MIPSCFPGLCLCQKIIELHGAVWRFESEVGQGLRVSVMFWDPEHQKPRDGRNTRRPGAARQKHDLREQEDGCEKEEKLETHLRI